MPTTTNFGWTTPADTDLVKDGALAIRTLGNGIDTSMVDLKGGTTGQVLSKASNTDMDFTWVAQDDSNAIQNAIVDAKGDLITATAADTPARLAVGTNGQILTADSTTATGLKWDTPASGGGLTLLSTTSLSGTSTSISISASSYVNLLVVFKGVYGSANNTVLNMRLNSDTGSNYNYIDWRRYPGSTAGDFQASQNQTSQYMTSASLGTSSGASSFSGSMDIFRCNDTSQINYEFRIMGFNDSSVGSYQHTVGKYMASAAISNLTILNVVNSNTLSGTVYVYGVK